MERVGIRDLKAHLSRHLKRVRAGSRLLVTERGRTIAAIQPVETSVAMDWANALVREGLAHWSGGKPAGVSRPAALATEHSLSTAVLEDRR